VKVFTLPADHGRPTLNQKDRAMPEEITTATAAQTQPSEDALSDADLDAVSGGLNPQPLPPIERGFD